MVTTIHTILALFVGALIGAAAVAFCNVSGNTDEADERALQKELENGNLGD